MTARHKAILLILDGLGDRPSLELGGRTPLEAARTPNLDRLAGEGLCGLMDPLRPGLPVDTQTGTGLLLGLPPADIRQLARGPVEAAGVGLPLEPGDVALRCNFATLERNGDGYTVLDRRAGRIDAGTCELAEAVNALPAFDGIRATLVPAAQHRAVLRLSGQGLSAEVSDTDPGGSLHEPASLPWSQSLHADLPAAVRTADGLNQFLGRVVEILEGHPVNEARRQRGEPIANGLLTRGAGTPQPCHNLLHHMGLSAALVAGDRTALGLAAISGFARVTRDTFTCMPNTDLAGKSQAALDALRTHDFVWLHVKATDVLSHDRKPKAKQAFLERLDTALAELFELDVVIGVASDHSTSCVTGCHTGDPVPVLLRAPGGRRDASTSFGEDACMRGGLGRLSAADFLRSLLDAAGAIRTYTPADEFLL